MNKKIAIIPYFGTPNVYFQLWLNSCGSNNKIDFLLITDICMDTYAVPSNVRIVNSTLSKTRELFEKKIGFNVALDRPYKLCDYKPYYGYFFEEYIQNYDFWGYCDCDTIWGDISSFLTEDIFDSYDKLLRLGHLSFVRNQPEINRNFLRYETYKIVMSSDVIYGLDESVGGYHLGFAGELIDSGYRFWQKDNIACDIDFRNRSFRVVTAPERACIFEYDCGKTYRIDCVDNEIIRTETAYIHLQKRKMDIEQLEDVNHFLIIPNSFCEYDEERLMKPEFWQLIEHEEEGYFDRRKEKLQSMLRDVKRLLHEPHKIDSVIFRIKGKR